MHENEVSRKTSSKNSLKNITVGQNMAAIKHVKTSFT